MKTKTPQDKPQGKTGKKQGKTFGLRIAKALDAYNNGEDVSPLFPQPAEVKATQAQIEAFSLRIAKALTTSPLDVLSKSTARPPVQTQMDLAELARMRDEIAKTVGLGCSETLAVHRWIMGLFKETFGIDPIGE